MVDRRRYKDRREYLIKAVQRRRKRIRDMALDYKGGMCQVCGYSKCREALEFHHIDSSGKDFGISDRGYTRSWNKIKKELDKCLLVCANCHREIHSGMQLPREIVVVKSGEFRETFPPQRAEYGNPEPSSNRIKKIREGAETRAYARTPEVIWGKRPTPSLDLKKGEEIVQAQEKFWGTCNH